jgi:sodium-dependent dicarboxylate transporter 2/3/5
MSEPIKSDGKPSEKAASISTFVHRDYHFNKKNCLIFLIAIAVMAIIILLPTPPELSNQGETIALTQDGKKVFGVLCFAVVLWMTEAIPFSAASLMMFILLTFFGLCTFDKAVNMGLGKEVIMFLTGAMGISAALTDSGLAERIMLITLDKVGTKTRHIVFAFMGIGVALSMWVTDMAVAAMLLPLGVTILNAAGAKPLQSNFGRALMIGIVWGCLIGGIATPAGCGPNVVAIGYMKELAGQVVTFPQWMIVGVPASLMMLPIGYFILIHFFKPEIDELPVSPEGIHQLLVDRGKLDTREKHTLLIFGITVFLWLAGPLLRSHLNFPLSDAGIALMGFLLCFVPGIDVFDKWQDAARSIDWGGLMLIAGGLTAGKLLAETGAARYLAWLLLHGLASWNPIFRVAMVIITVELMKIFFSSNSVTGAIVLPLIIVLAQDLSMPAWSIAGPAAIATSMAFIMVTSSPTNVIPYSSGYFSIPDFAKVGVVMTVVGIVCVTLSVVIFGNFNGMNIFSV